MVKEGKIVDSSLLKRELDTSMEKASILKEERLQKKIELKMRTLDNTCV